MNNISVLHNENSIHYGSSASSFSSGYLSEIVYGGIDGAITTFAVVAGASGANLSIKTILILGFANLIADGVSMSVGNYFSTKATRDNFYKHLARENWEIDHLREREIEEIREIYIAKGFQGKLLEEVVEVITSDRKIWLDTMMKDELGLILEERQPIHTALATFFSFFAIGLIPLLAFVFSSYLRFDTQNLFFISCLSTGLALGIIGYFRSKVTQKNPWISVIETLGLGGLAAAIAFYIGVVLERWVL
ncbi:MAG: VIT1/CCC1 transporter family protein [Bacteroidia bacterium]|nr:VIT1/CCC1 transporter family protein [Bacteroidia bacterium]MDW8159628.1 VIT1/CCC1 transporter family protein [Bacteroidia bacterium]